MGKKRRAPSNGTIELEPSTHTYLVDGEPVPLCVSDVMELSGIVKPYPEEAMYHVERARRLGEFTHKWTQSLDQGNSDVASLEGTRLLPYVVAYQRFREEHRPNWSHIEQPFVRDDIAGTPDRIGRIRLGDERVPAIVDLKTSRKPETFWGVQLSGYLWLLKGDPGWRLFVVWLQKDGTFKLLNYSIQTPVWEAAITLARWQMIGRR